MPPSHSQSSYPSPSSASSGDQYPYYTQPPPPPMNVHQSQVPVSDSHPDRAALSLNLSSLSVASPTNMSPINPSPHPSTQPSSHVSPITPISPSAAGLHAHHAHHHGALQPPFTFAPPAGPDHGVRYDEQYDYAGRRLTSSRSSSSSDKSVPRKRSFPTVPALSTNVEEPYGDHPMDASPYDEVDMGYGGLEAEGSPVDGSTSGGEQDDQLKPLEAPQSSQGSAGLSSGAHGGIPQVGMLGKPLGTNNFVTKLYQYVSSRWLQHPLGLISHRDGV